MAIFIPNKADTGAKEHLIKKRLCEKFDLTNRSYMDVRVGL